MKKFIALYIILLMFFTSNCSFGKVSRLTKYKNNKNTNISEVKLTNEEIMAQYMKAMESQIKSNWIPPNNSFRNKTVVNFLIMRDGTIKSTKIEKTSGDKEFDTEAMKALYATGKVAPLPKHWLGSYLDVTFTFECVSYLVRKDRYDR